MQNKDLTLFELLNIVWKSRKLILIITLSCAALALAASLVMTDVYSGSITLEIGKYYSFSKGRLMEKMELIEDPRIVESVLKNDSTVYELKKADNLKGTIASIRDNIKVDIKSAPLITVRMSSTDTKEISDSLQFLANFIMDEHKKKYSVSLKALEDNINANRQKILKNEGKIKENERKKEQIQNKIKSIEAQRGLEQSQIKTNVGYQKNIIEAMGRSADATKDIKDKVSKIQGSNISPMELLYLQTTVQNSELRQLDFQKELSSLKEREFEHSKQLSEMQKMAADLQMSLAEIDGQNSDLENQNEDFRMSIASFENLKNSTFTTRVRSNPVILDKPVAPRPVLYTLLAANFGLLMSLIAAFLLEYIRAQKAAYRA